MSEVKKNNLTDEKGILVPVKIELVESSGPVSPPYQFNLSIVLNNEGNCLRIHYSYEGKFIAGEAQDRKVIDELIPKDKALKFLNSLLDLDALGVNKELDEDKKNNVGISFNELNIQIGAKNKSKILYTLSDLDESTFAKETKIIEFIKKLENWNSF
ncbi:MAG TPA: hypothetical protein PLX69_23325 [Leptospiraceae bacterium]|nr:hypothetical protein [Leptospiraceae bacterium]